jgi:SH3 domain-containing protein
VAGNGAPEQALAAYVSTTMQKEFLDDCGKTDAAKDAGKICATFKGERGEQRAYVLGPTLSQGTLWVIVENRNGQWAVAGSQPLNADNAGVPGIPWPLRTGADIIVASGGAPPCVNVRTGPGLNQPAVDCIPNGAKIRLSAGPTDADNYQWWQVEGRTGWVVSLYLRYPDAAQ